DYKMKADICHYIIAWVESNLTTRSGMEELESVTGYSRRTMERWFGECYGLTPAEYLYRRRMTRAAVLLRMTVLPVTEIAALFHYHSSQNFTRAFKNFTGFTPQKYRQTREWFCRQLQLPLDIKSDIFENYEVTFLPDIYIKGDSLHTTECLRPGQFNEKIKTFLLKSIISSDGNGNEIYVAAKATPPSNITSGRAENTEISIHAGIAVSSDEEWDAHIKKGRFILWSFCGELEKYLILSKMFSVMVMSNTPFACVFDYNYIHFKQGEGENIACDMYIPVTIPDDMK
ncbi:helix-turn-helix transcriptional regulator, partial [Salmonella enterica subsp. enterica serovar Javiana]|nr:helix-turn-helix transcriptional regulator [Salmonella enterica]EDW1237551.1 helix-turn-helix transcriptional regulator [Salmonella enterica subsp. enterica serovar Javiana]ECH2506768.1 helix-turn-helix transcriptional regulator [Salmonella enterica]EDQ1666510.1 helix-turn-helix transcriptional regulator [Salmonella enterica]EDX8066629.1 helix-turn-helix transcriptional regulator [Salmonella enterica subsp. enterica serovar Javiana]